MPLALLGREPFMPAKVPVRPENHYRFPAVLLPAFGLGQWLLMGSSAHALLRLTSHPSALARVLDTIGLGMLIPMPALWIADATLIATNRFRMPELGFVNVPTQLWETALIAIGLYVHLGAPLPSAVLAATAASTVYVLGAARVLR